MQYKQKKFLVVMAAGIGSRFGGIKQIAQVGPNGETLLDYSLQDAISCGFTDVIYIIRQDIYDDMRHIITDKYIDQIQAHWVYQEIPEGRKKPLGTAHALLQAIGIIDGPCLVINADDYYGKNSMKIASERLNQSKSDTFAMVGYMLGRTLSDHTPVNRGICSIKHGLLSNIVETLGIYCQDDIIYDLDGNILSSDTIVSLNFWLFGDGCLRYLYDYFKKRYNGSDYHNTAEIYLPSYTNNLIQEYMMPCEVLTTTDTWIGITNTQDLIVAREFFADLK